MKDTITDLLRHGEPVGGRRFRGHGVDDPLSDKGWTQMWHAVGDETGWNRIVSSPMQRCRAFAEALGEKCQIPVSLEADLREVGFGAWEGRSPDEIQAANLAEYEAFYQDPVRNRPPGAEPLDAFAARVSRAYDRIVADHPGEQLLIVAHAGVIRAIIGHTLDADPLGWYRIKVQNGGISRIRHGRYGSRLELLNGRLGATRA